MSGGAAVKAAAGSRGIARSARTRTWTGLRGVPGADLPVFVKAFGKLDDLLDQAGEDRITVKLRLQSQPWHMYSGVIVRCILAASTLEGGKTAAKSVMAAVAAHREEFEFDRHCRGPNLDATPNDIIRRIERCSGVKLAEGIVNLMDPGRLFAARPVRAGQHNRRAKDRPTRAAAPPTPTSIPRAAKLTMPHDQLRERSPYRRRYGKVVNRYRS